MQPNVMWPLLLLAAVVNGMIGIYVFKQQPTSLMHRSFGIFALTHCCPS